VHIKRIHIITLFILLMSNLFVAHAQQTNMIEFSANRIKYIKAKGAQMLIGNVVFKHEGAIITCDSAYRFDNNTLEAYDHIMIRKGDSLTITGDNLKYDGNKKVAVLEGNVVCIEKDMTLTTPAMSYDVTNSVASYFGGGTINNKDNVLTSRNGYYYSASKTMAFKHNVKLNNPKFKVLGDTLQYNTASKIAYFTGPTNIVSDSTRLYCEYGWYNTETEKSHLNTNAIIYSKESELHADSIFYDRKAGYGKAYSCVQIIDTLNKTELLGKLAEHFENTGISIVTGNALLIKVMKDDSLLLSADTLFSHQMKSLSTKKDSIIVKAYKHVKLYKSDLTGIADSLVYTNSDSTIVLFNSPILWADSAQLNAREIKIRLTGNGVKSFELLGNAFVITQEDSIKFNQIKGKEIFGTFANDSINRIEVKGNAQVAYFIKNEKKKYVAFSKTNSARVNVYFEKGQMDRITFIDKPTSQLIPMKTVDPVKERLKGFTWNPFKKPKSKYELLKF